MTHCMKVVSLFLLSGTFLSAAIAEECTVAKSSSTQIVGQVKSEAGSPVAGLTVEVTVPQRELIRTKTDKYGCYTATVNDTRKYYPVAVELKRKKTSATLVRAVSRCDYSGAAVCAVDGISWKRPNTVYLTPFDGPEKGNVFANQQFRSALASRFVTNMQELEGENVLRRFKARSELGSFKKLMPPGLALYESDAKSDRSENINTNSMSDIGDDLNALAVIGGDTSIDERKKVLDLNSFYVVPGQDTWSFDDQVDTRILSNTVKLSRKLSPKWTYYTMLAMAKREFHDALGSDKRTDKLKRIKVYLQAQRNQLDVRKGIKQNELLDLLCDVRKALGERCGRLMLSMDR